MQEAGFKDFVRGECGSDTQHLSYLEYQIQQDTARLKEIQKAIEINAAAEKFAKEIHKTYLEIDNMGRRTITGKMSISKEDFDLLSELAKEGISSRGTIQRVKSDSQILQQRNWNLQRSLERQRKQLETLMIRGYRYWQALKVEPEKVETFLDSVLEPLRKKEENRPKRFCIPKERIIHRGIRKDENRIN